MPLHSNMGDNNETPSQKKEEERKEGREEGRKEEKEGGRKELRREGRKARLQCKPLILNLERRTGRYRESQLTKVETTSRNLPRNQYQGRKT